MGALIYTLCAMTAGCCAWMLYRAFRATRARLLLWSAVCFGLLAVNNVTVMLDQVVFPSINLFVYRTAIALLAVVAMLYGLVWDER